MPTSLRPEKAKLKEQTEAASQPTSGVPSWYKITFRERVRQTSTGWQPQRSERPLAAEWSCVVTQRNSIFHALSPLVCNCPSRTLSGSFTACALHLVTETLLVPMLPHAFAALVLGDFCFSSFFERAHSDFQICESRFNHLIPRIATHFRCGRSSLVGFLRLLMQR